MSFAFLGRNGYLRPRVMRYDSNVMQRHEDFCSETCFLVLNLLLLEGTTVEVTLAHLNTVCSVCAGLIITAGPRRHLCVHESAGLPIVSVTVQWKDENMIHEIGAFVRNVIWQLIWQLRNYNSLHF